jgi:hypothetical protein
MKEENRDRNREEYHLIVGKVPENLKHCWAAAEEGDLKTQGTDKIPWTLVWTGCSKTQVAPLLTFSCRNMWEVG